MRAPKLASALLPLAIAVAALIVSVGSTASAFRSPTDSLANSITAAPDFRAPAVAASAVGKTQGGATGFVKKGGTYFVYASVTDSGNPASGTAGVSANLTSLTTGSKHGGPLPRLLQRRWPELQLPQRSADRRPRPPGGRRLLLDRDRRQRLQLRLDQLAGDGRQHGAHRVRPAGDQH